MKPLDIHGGASSLKRPENSGIQWVSRFPSSRALSDLKQPFRDRVEAFVSALRDAGAMVVVNSTLRDRRRAYLMHWSWRIAKGNADPENVPALDGVKISWSHLDSAGKYSRAASVNAAREMVRAFGIDRLGVAPALASRHLLGCAIDMSISWRGMLSLPDGNGEIVKITTPPWNGMNIQLHRVGSSYGVIKYNRGGRDEPHWSDTGA